MTFSGALSLASLFIGVTVTLLVILFMKMRQDPKLTNLLVSLLRESNQQNRSLTHLVVSRDFQTYAGLQSLSQNPQSQATIPSPNSTYSNAEYIPRDDTTEAMRIKAFGGAVGYGEVSIPDDDSELAEALSEMVANGQVDLGEGVY